MSAIELQDPTSNTLRDSLIGVRSGGILRILRRRNWNERSFWSRKKLIGCGVCSLFIILPLVLGSVIVLTRTNSVVIIPTTVLPVPNTTTIKPTTTTTSVSTTLLTTPTTLTSTTSMTKSTTTRSIPTATGTASTTFHPTTLNTLPPNAINKPPISLLYEMRMRPVFTQINCTFYDVPTFKFIVRVLESSPNYTGVGRRKELAKTAAAMAANEALFGLHYPEPIPVPKYPCH